MFLLLGLAGAGWLAKQYLNEQQIQQYYQDRMVSEIDEYTKAYQQWLMLPDGERSELPWQLDESGKPKTAEQVQKEQKIRLFIDYEKLLQNKPEDGQLAAEVYGLDWEKKLQQYQIQKAMQKTILVGSALCGGSGAVIVIWGTLAFIVQAAGNLYKRKKSKPVKKNETVELKPENKEETKDSNSSETAPEKKPLTALLNCPAYENNKDNVQKKAEQNVKSELTGKKISFEHFYMDEDSAKSQDEAQTKVSHLSLAEAIRKRMHTGEVKTESATLLNVDKILSGNLDKLTEEIAAIRHYASEQQERIKKLQDGYDWNIIKNFCLRVIRCIDNLEIKIKTLKKSNINIKELEEVKDELLFALESSGIEQFSPEVNSVYKGQERAVEAVRDKELAGSSEKAGRIAEVLKCGYKYCLDETNYKVIRAAQVKIYN